MAMCCDQPEPVIVDDTVYIYYTAINVPHNYIPTTRRRWQRGVATFSAIGSPPWKPAIGMPGRRGDRQALHRPTPQAVPQRRHLDEGIDPRRGLDARLAAIRALANRRPEKSREMLSTIRCAGKKTQTSASCWGKGDSPEFEHHPGAHPCDDAEQ